MRMMMGGDEMCNALCKYLQPWRGKYLPLNMFVIVEEEGDIGVLLADILAGIEELNMENAPLPIEAIRTLELFSGATSAHAIALLRWASDQPIELTPEEEAEQEAATLAMSEILDVWNSAEPDQQVPVPYPSHVKH